jgi:hypothetical protein
MLTISGLNVNNVDKFYKLERFTHLKTDNVKEVLIKKIN